MFHTQAIAAAQNANFQRSLCHLKSKLSTSKTHRIIYMEKKRKKSESKYKRPRTDTKSVYNVCIDFTKKKSRI